MKKKLLCVLLALCFAFACQTAFAVSFSREEYRQIVFEAIGGASDANDKLCDNLWLGTVEAAMEIVPFISCEKLRSAMAAFSRTCRISLAYL